MNPEAGRHAAVIFIAVFGGAALWFAAFIFMMKKIPAPPIGSDPWEHAGYRAASRFWGAVVAIPALIFIGFVSQFW